MRLIDADALFIELTNWMDKKYDERSIYDLITNAPTVQREGWVSVPSEPEKHKWANLLLAVANDVKTKFVHDDMTEPCDIGYVLAYPNNNWRVAEKRFVCGYEI